MASWRWAIIGHEQFEELCVLAASGSLDSAEVAQVRAHLDECESCQALFADVGDVLAIYLSEITGDLDVPNRERELHIKNSILVAASKEKESVYSSQPIRAVLKARAAGASNS
jgi:anti-sigma factor ChrR (cupin superfamily)